MENLKKYLYVIIVAVVVVALLQGLRATALKSAYDASASTTINDSQGVTHTVAAGPISGDLTALIYNIASGLVMLFAILYIIIDVSKGVKG